MSLFGVVGLAAAERLEQSVNASWALASYWRIVEKADERPEIRAKAAQGALRCIFSLADERRLHRLIGIWSKLRRRDPALWQTALQGCKILLHSGRQGDALKLARAEATRCSTPLSRYLLARCYEANNQTEQALDEYQKAADLSRRGEPKQRAAERRTANAVACACRARRIEALLKARQSRRQVLAELAGVELAAATPQQALWFACAGLLSPSRFARAAALSDLQQLARLHPELNALAAAVAARHADHTGELLSKIESDHISAMLQEFPDKERGERAVQRLAARRRIAEASAANEEQAIVEATSLVAELSQYCHRTRELLASRPAAKQAPPQPRLRNTATQQLVAAHLGLDILSAVREQRYAQTVKLLEQSAQLPASAAVAPLWSALMAVLQCSSNAAVQSALKLTKRLLNANPPAPPRGYLPLAMILNTLAKPELELLALREATARGEPDSLAILASKLTHRGWDAQQQGCKEEAVRYLREAKELWARCA